MMLCFFTNFNQLKCLKFLFLPYIPIEHFAYLVFHLKRPQTFLGVFSSVKHNYLIIDNN